MINYRNYWNFITNLLSKVFNNKRIVWNLFFAAMALSIGIVSSLLIPIFLKRLIDSLSESNHIKMTLVIISYGSIWLLSQLSFQIRTLLNFKIEQRIVYMLEVQVLSHLYNLPHRYFVNQKPGTITSILRRAQNNISLITLGLFFYVFPTLLEFLCVIFLIAYLYPIIYCLILGGTLISFFLYSFISMKYVLKSRQTTNEVDQDVDGIIVDWLSNYEAVKVFNKKNLAINICKENLKKREKAQIKFMNELVFVRIGQVFILSAGLTSLTYIIGINVLKGILTVGDFVLFNGYILQFIIPIGLLGQIMQDVKKSLIDMKGVIEVLHIESEIKESNFPIYLRGEEHQIKFENVTFEYNDRLILKNLSFSVDPRSTFLILGKTGIGKSTIAKLLLRLYDPTEGKIFVDQINLRDISFQSLYKTVGWVPQESYFLNDSIKNNLLFVNAEASIKDMEEALDQANLLDHIDTFPKGLDTPVGNQGLKLSGGEKQRLALARLFLKQPKICIFDEATSFLDHVTETIIQQNIERHFPDMTKIIITHKSFNIKTDKILNLNDIKYN